MKKRSRNRANKNVRRAMIISLLIALGVAGWYAYPLYQLWSGANSNIMTIEKGEEAPVFIPTGSTTKSVATLLANDGLIADRDVFLEVAVAKNYAGKNIVPGMYIVKGSMTVDDLVTHLRAGRGREEVSITFNNVRTMGELAARISSTLEIDSAAFHDYVTSPEVMSRYGFDEQSMITMFIPDTYRANWAIPIDSLMGLMASKYRNFWTPENKQKAKDLGLSQSEVATLASIVVAEQTKKPDEWPTIAGLYLNRLKRGMRLQSDPTVVYANGDWSIRRVREKHLAVDSPYNTYKYAGLPPGPILLPPKDALQAVLDADEHNYLFMCAKPEYSGYHNFSTSLRQHNLYAAQYRRWLDSEGIR